MEWYDYGKRFYEPEIGRFQTVDPLAEKYYFQSSFVYGGNNPIRFVEKNGENPVDAAVIIGSAVITVTDIALITTGVVTYGIILHQAPDGSLALNDKAAAFFSDLTGYKWQQQQDQKGKESLDKSQANTEKSINKNYPKPSPDGTPEVKRKGDKLGTAVVLTGLGAEMVRSCDEISKVKGASQTDKTVIKNADNDKNNDPTSGFVKGLKTMLNLLNAGGK